MSEIVKLRTRAEIDEEAATWIWRMEAGPDGGVDPAGFDAWLRQDPRHRRAVEELTQVWEALDGIGQVRTSPDIAATAKPAVESSVARRRYGWLAAAALMLVAVGAVMLVYRSSERQTFATAVGQHRNVSLSDGTTVALNTNTIVEMKFDRHSREIYLRKGEAHFEVAADRGRPFRVHAGDAVVRAIGTGFEIRVRADHHVDVLVNEGRVEVEAEPRPSATQPANVETGSAAIAVITVRAVSAGQRLSTATANYAVTPVSAEQVSSQLAWRDGAVVFDSEPLSQAITEIQRYTDARIVISDPRIAALPVGGRFRTDDLQGFLDGLEAALPVTIHRTSDGTVYIAPHN